MNAHTELYIKQAASYFPIMGTEEKTYLSKLSSSIEDYCEDDNISLECIVQVFGEPHTVVENYLAQSDIQYVVKRVQIRKYIRRIVTVVLSAVFLIATLTAVHFGVWLHAVREAEDYVPPVYSSGDGLPSG